MFAIAVAMSVVALWRLPGARHGDPLRRTLWGCSTGFAIALWSRYPPVREAIGALGIVDLDALVKYLISIAAALSMANYSVTGYLLAGDQTPRHIAISRRVAHFAQRSTFVVVPLMVALFFFVIDRSRPSHDFAYEHAGEWPAALFMSCFYLYLGASAWTVAYQWTHVSRRADSRVFRIGLALGAAAAWLYATYAAVRFAYMWTAMFLAVPATLTRAVENLSDALNLLVALLFLTGASLPTTNVVAERGRTWRCLWRLHSLRRDLLTAFPEVALQQVRSRIRELTRLSPPMDVRLDRWTQEIGDAVDILRHHATDDLWAVAEREGLWYSDPEPAAEALWVKGALESARQSCGATIPVRPLPDKPFATSQGEAFWLVRVQAVYAKISPQQVRRLCATAGYPCAGEAVRCPVHAGEPADTR